MNSEHGEVEEEGQKTKLSMDSTKVPTTKRPHIDSDEDEQDTPAKKRQCSSNESETPEKNNTEIISDKNGIDENNVKEEKDAEPSEDKPDLDDNSSLNTDVKKENEEDREKKSIKVQSEMQNLKDENNSATDESPPKVKDEIISEDSPSKGSDNTKAASVSDSEKTEDDTLDDTDDHKENSKGNGTREKRTAKNRSTDTEVVDGLELSVECASDKEESSSDSADDEKEKKPRPKTLIVKAEPNESELECGSSDGEKSDAQEANETVEAKSKRGKRRSTRTSFSKLKASGSEDSHNNNSDEDYSPRTKKKLKKSPATKRSTKRSSESKRGRGGARRNVQKRNTEDVSDNENSDAVSADKADKTMKKNKAEEELSGKESSMSNDDKSNSDNEESTKGRRTRRSNANPMDNKQIQSLRKYIKAAGVRVKSYQEIWADCRNNTERINRLKELLEKEGVTGRPTLEKCKRVKKKNEKIKEVSELDKSNIISEGRITRARKSMESNKKPMVEMPPRHREARNTLKRLRTVIDSDSD